MVEGYRDINAKRVATKTIMARYKKRKFDRRMLLLDMQQHSSKIILVQARVRGWYARRRWMPKIKQAQWEKSKRQIGLSKVKDGLDVGLDDELDDLADFFEDEEKAKGENFDKQLIIPEGQNEEMKQMLSMLNRKPKASLPPLNQKISAIRQNSDNRGQGHNRFSSDTDPNHTDRSNTSSKNLSEINRKMLRNNNDYINGVPDPNFFHAAGSKRERSPTSVSGAMTENDFRNENQRRDSEGANFNSNPAVNNLMNHSRASFTGSQVTSKKFNMKEEKRKYVESWGVQSEESKKLIEARYLKMTKNKRKKKVLNADDKLKIFRNNSRKSGQNY